MNEISLVLSILEFVRRKSNIIHVLEQDNQYKVNINNLHDEDGSEGIFTSALMITKRKIYEIPIPFTTTRNNTL